MLDELDRPDLPSGWRMEADTLHPGRAHAICIRCAGLHGVSVAPLPAAV